MSTLTFQEIQAILYLNRLSSGGAGIRSLFEEGIKPSEILARIESKNLFGRSESFHQLSKIFNPEKEMEECEKRGIRLLTWFDSDYPRVLKEISDPPLVLYTAGNFEESDEAAVAIVGTRHPSFYGISHAKKFSGELAQAGLTVVSGFARGIDQIAHEAALGIPHGRTVAVLGCGIDIEYPRGSRKLFDRIKECGAVVSEYPLGTSPRAEFFPRRNRIISGLSLGVLVVEAHSRSGSLITAHEAADQGRDVFAIPGSLEQLTSRGTHRLIKEGAFLVESPQDILEILAPNLWPLASDSRLSERKEERQELISNLENSDLEKVLGLLTHGPLTYDEIAHRSAFPISQLAGMMLDLELKRKVHKHRDGRFVKSS